MSHAEKIKQELFNDKAFQALYSGIKPEEKLHVETIINNLVSLAENAITGFSTKVQNNSFSKEEIEMAISDRTGRK
jgi:hypothetical protein